VATVLLIRGFVAPADAHVTTTYTAKSPHWPPLAVLLAFPVGMALATGVEAPSSAIAQLGQLDDAGRRRFGRATLWATLGIDAWLTLGFAALAVALHVGLPLPSADTTQIAEIAQAASGRGALFAMFQLASTLLLLAAASSSFQAGPGLLKALSRTEDPAHAGLGVLPVWLGRVNRHHTPFWGVVVFFGASALLVVAAEARDQELVLFYAVAVFVSFLAGLAAMARFSWREGAGASLAVNVVGGVAVLVTLVGNLARGYPIASLVAALAVAALLYRRWVRAGRPRGVSDVDRLAEQELGEEDPAPT
jgi:hypothetical protein